MIFLIDDNLEKQQQNKYKAMYLFDGRFDAFLEKNYIFETKDKFEAIKPKLVLAKAILLHNTFSDADSNGEQSQKSIHIRNEIERLALAYAIPLVLFSGKYKNQEVRFDDDVSPKLVEIEKDAFYENLYFFLENVMNKGEIELKIIAYGKQYELEQMLKYHKEVLLSLSKIDKQRIFIPSMVNLKSLRHFYTFSKVNLRTDFNSYLENIEDREISVLDFINETEKIKNKAIDKYG